MTTRIRAAIPIPIGSEKLSAAEPARTRTNRISSVAYATEERGSEANTASAVALPRRSCRCCAVGSGVPTKSRLSRCRRTGPILLRAARLYLKRLRLPVGLRDVLEPRVLGQEHDLDRADGAVALLADDDVGDVGLARREVLLVLRLAIEEEDEVGVLLQGARFTKVRELRPEVAGGARLHRARELGEGDHRHVQLLRERLERPGDLRDLLLAALHRRAPPHELEAVADHELQPVPGPHPPRLGPRLEPA